MAIGHDSILSVFTFGCAPVKQAWVRSVFTTSSPRSVDEDRQDLLGHRSGRITSHYSAAELSRLIEAAEKVCERDGRWPEMVVLRGALAAYSRKIPAKRIGP